MANKLYPLGKKAFLDGGIVVLIDTLKACLLTSAYTYAATHQYYSDVSANVVGTPQVLATKLSLTGGVFKAANTTFTAVAAGSTVGYIGIYKDTGVAGTSALVALIDTAPINGGANAAISFATNGSDIVVTWDAGATGIFTL